MGQFIVKKEEKKKRKLFELSTHGILHGPFGHRVSKWPSQIVLDSQVPPWSDLNETLWTSYF